MKALLLGFLLFLGSFAFSSLPAASADGGAVIAQLFGYVMPTNSFDVGNLSVGSEASLELGTGSSRDVIYRVIRVLGSVAGTVAILLFVFGGLAMITAQDENRYNYGKNILVLTSIGVVVVFSAYIIVQFVLALIFSV